jgi:DNA-binding CsgD family transcriptional regulator
VHENGPVATQPSAAAGISPREAEVLALVGEHRSNAEIGARLFISVRTVETHVSSLLRKLGVPDRRALALLAGDLATAERSSEALASLPSPPTSFIGRMQERAERGASALTDLGLAPVETTPRADTSA